MSGYKKTVVAPTAQNSAAASANEGSRANPGSRPTQGTAATQKQPVGEATARPAQSVPTQAAPARPVAGRSAAAGNNHSKNSRRPADRLKVVQADADSFEIIDDVIPLDESGIPMIGTNELEIIDDPIIDEDDLN